MAIGILGLVDTSLNLANKIVERMNMKEHTKYIDRVRAAKLAFMTEDNKPDGERIDSKCENLRDLLELETSTMNTAIAAGVMESKS